MDSKRTGDRIARSVNKQVGDQDNRYLGAQDALEALLSTRVTAPYRLVLNGKFVGSLRLMSPDLDCVYRARATLQEQRKALKDHQFQILADLVWLRFAVVDENNEPLWTMDQINELRKADNASIQKLLAAIHSLSGVEHASPDWGGAYGHLIEAASEEIGKLLETVETYFGADNEAVEETWEKTKTNLMEAIAASVKETVQGAAMLAVQQFELSRVLEESPVSDEDLGNSSEQTPSLD